jgi:hypothetical protein
MTTFKPATLAPRQNTTDVERGTGARTAMPLRKIPIQPAG